jgi:hypothetical protein
MMETSNEKKNRLLGEPYGTATNRLRKMLLFDLVRKVGLDYCFRCGYRIETIEEFSIEHTIPWQGAENPKEAFFDLEHIAYSHSKCNSGAGLRYSGVRKSTPHGITRYNKGCRCLVCKVAHSAQGKQWKRNVNYRNINKLPYYQCGGCGTEYSEPTVCCL